MAKWKTYNAGDPPPVFRASLPVHILSRDGSVEVFRVGEHHDIEWLRDDENPQPFDVVGWRYETTHPQNDVRHYADVKRPYVKVMRGDKFYVAGRHSEDEAWSTIREELQSDIDEGTTEGIRLEITMLTPSEFGELEEFEGW
jgi:hypothetical protein